MTQNELVTLQTERFTLRSLTAEDITINYLNWFKDPVTQRYIDSAKNNQTLKTLKNYVSDRMHRSDVLFLGIFTPNEQHIGNVKYEPINIKNSYAVMGILVGDPNWRNRGVAREVIPASADYLQKNYGIKYIALGVTQKNQAAVMAYQKIGFKIQSVPSFIHTNKESMEMVLDLQGEPRHVTL